MDTTTLLIVIGACWVIVGVALGIAYLRGNRAVERPGRTERKPSLRKE